MRRELAAAERHVAVRDAARGWAKAGAIGEDTRLDIDSRFPLDRVGKPLVWRILIFFFSCVILCSFFGLVAATNRPSRDGFTVLALFFGVALAVATEFQQGPLRFDGTGGEAATSFLSLAFLTAAAASSFLGSSASPPRIGSTLLFAGVVCAAGWWRWGFPVYALFSAASVFFCISIFVPVPRLGWIAASAVLAILAARRRDDARLAPAHRAGMSVVLAAALAAAYAAVNLYSLDQGAIEEARPGPSAARLAGPLVRGLAIAATAIFPILLAMAGARKRSRLFLDLGIVFGALSLATLHSYVRLGPLWLVLTETGAGLVLLAIWTERFLGRGRGRERAGLTAEPLFEDVSRAQMLSAAAAAATFAPESRAAEPGTGLSAGGGDFGGGGASGEI